MKPLFWVLKLSILDQALVNVPLVARACQNRMMLGFSVAGTSNEVVPLESCATPSCEPVRESSGKLSSSDHSKRYVTAPTVPVATAFFTCSVGLSVSSCCVATGD